MNTLYKSVFSSTILGISIFLQSCSSSARTETEKKPVDEGPILETFVLEKGTLGSSLRIPGELVAFQQVDLYAKISSFVKKLHVDIGSQVREGQLLATMEAPELHAQLSVAASKLKSQEAIYLASKANYDRLIETSKTPGTISQSDIDYALAKQNSDLAQLDAARSTEREIADTRSYLEIRAPFSGVISSRNVSAGAYVGPSGKGSEFPLFTLVEQQKLRLVVSVPEAYTNALHGKSEVTFTVKSFPDQKFSAKVARQAGLLDNRLRSQRTEMDVMNLTKKLLPGMIAEVSIPLQSGAGSFVVPNSAILNSSQGLYLIKVSDNKAIWVPVKTGSQNGEKTEVFGDVKTGDTIVKTANEEIRNNSDAKNTKAISL